MRIKTKFKPGLIISLDKYRPLLRVIHLKKKPNGDGHLYASDGHRAIEIPVTETKGDRDGAIPADTLKLARIQKFNNENTKVLNVSELSRVGFEGGDKRSMTMAREPLNKDGEIVKNHASFPEMVLPMLEKARANEGQRFSINARYLYELSKAMGISPDDAITITLPVPNEDGNINKAIYLEPNKQDDDGDTCALVMPVKLG